MAKKIEKVESYSNESCHCEGWCCCGGKILLTLLTILWVVAAIMACFYACKASKAAQKLYDFNVLSAGGEANFKRMIKVYESKGYVDYMSQYAQQGEEQFGLWDSTTDQETTTSDDNTSTSSENFWSEGTLSAENIAALKENGVVYGPQNAKITILEFADASCGYCKRQIAQDKTVDTVMEQYPNDVNLIFKNFPIFNETAAEAMACAEDYLSAENYHQYVVAVFSADDATNVDALANLAANYWADATTIANCVNNGDKAAEVSATMTEGQSFGISWTPSSVIINNESGEFSLVPWAYPASTFVETIEALLS